MNAASESGYVNPIDAAIRQHKQFDISAYQKLDEVPYDFNRKRLSILLKKDNKNLIVSKGALKAILDVCSTVETGDGKTIDITIQQDKIQQRAEELGSEGFRVLGVAYRNCVACVSSDDNRNSFTKDDETNMTFLGYLALFDPPKADIADTLKYVFMATSANFGNMFSMAGISLVLPFLPLLPSQILLTNLLTDFPEMTIATDRVDREMVNKPRRMNIAFIRNFMVVFGLLSSVFDYLTFAAFLLLLHANSAQFRTGWFMESVISASMIVLVIRTRQSILTSKPGKYLLTATITIAIATLLIPYSPVASLLGFQPLPIEFLLVLAAIVGLYIICAENVKRIFYQHVQS
ncbi:cation transporting ATPase C-terminal domain-containing protein [Nostoc sp. LEGE 12447]|uniref:cation transporting ATPase C-terminal domain-containing protein n=1 Tax=Nostoc sp. LEGE 12447 TaxID=1828640 RepID=UPI001D1510DE|nr:cation transporting ATPase C-terminal domain-containing protein [Nostoc sp. LEGE 12447]